MGTALALVPCLRYLLIPGLLTAVQSRGLFLRKSGLKLQPRCNFARETPEQHFVRASAHRRENYLQTAPQSGNLVLRVAPM